MMLGKLNKQHSLNVAIFALAKIQGQCHVLYQLFVLFHLALQWDHKNVVIQHIQASTLI